MPLSGVKQTSNASLDRKRRKTAARKDALLKVDDKIQEERRRIAEQLVQDLREAGCSCELGEDGDALPLKLFN